mgnify:CR=1 FL=1
MQLYGKACRFQRRFDLVGGGQPVVVLIDQQRDLLAGILTAKGVEADVGETLNTLVAKVADISGSQDKVGQAMVICDSAKKCVIGNASFTADIED